MRVGTATCEDVRRLQRGPWGWAGARESGDPCVSGCHFLKRCPPAGQEDGRSEDGPRRLGRPLDVTTRGSAHGRGQGWGAERVPGVRGKGQSAQSSSPAPRPSPRPFPRPAPPAPRTGSRAAQAGGSRVPLRGAGPQRHLAGGGARGGAEPGPRGDAARTAGRREGMRGVARPGSSGSPGRNLARDIFIELKKRSCKRVFLGFF